MQDKYSFHEERFANGEELKGERTNIAPTRAARKRRLKLSRERKIKMILLYARNRIIRDKIQGNNMNNYGLVAGRLLFFLSFFLIMR